jgi:hypothetical protein
MLEGIAVGGLTTAAARREEGRVGNWGGRRGIQHRR